MADFRHQAVLQNHRRQSEYYASKCHAKYNEPHDESGAGERTTFPAVPAEAVYIGPSTEYS